FSPPDLHPFPTRRSSDLAVEYFFRHFLRRAERVDPRIVDQNIDTAVTELDRSSGHFARAGRVSKVRRNKIRFASCCADFRNRLPPALGIAAYDNDMDSKLGQFGGCRPANPARSSCNQCCRRIGSHLPFLIRDFGVISKLLPETSIT